MIHVPATTYDTYTSRRSAVVGLGPVVASSQPAASHIGVQVMENGGTAADAAVATAAALQVTQPCSTGLGGDAFFVYYEAETGGVFALNGSGALASSLAFDDVARVSEDKRLPPFHPYTVTVPGAAGAWEALRKRFGRLTLASLLEPAANLADRGFAVAPMTALWWSGGVDRQLKHRRHGHELLLDGSAPRAGEAFRNPTLAHTLWQLGAEGPSLFYGGEIGRRIVDEVRHEGGALSLADLAAYEPEWVETIHTDFEGYRIHECPPNGQGLAALLALAIYREAVRRVGARDASSPDAGVAKHLQVEAMRLAFADTARYLGDPGSTPVPVEELLSRSYAADRALLLSPDRRIEQASPGNPFRAGDDTVYFCTADDKGNLCSFINSNYMGFGTGIVPEGCGFSLQNRGHGFYVEAGHPNAPAPGKRPYHTIIPGMAVRIPAGAADDGRPADTRKGGAAEAAGGATGGGVTRNGCALKAMAFGVMGGMMQPQGHLQVVSAVLREGLDAQSALDAARFMLEGGEANGRLLVEDGIDGKVLATLRARHGDVEVVSGRRRAMFGLGQVIAVADNDVRWAGSDPRGDGTAIGR